MAKKKPGSLSNESKKFILEHKNDMTSEEISEKLGVDLQKVEHVLDVFGNLPEDNIAWKEYLRKSSEWVILKRQFSTDELDKFQETFVKLMQQFKDDLLSSEQTQVFHLIKLDIMMDRNLESKARSRNQIYALENMQKAIVEKYGGDYTKMPPGDRDTITGIGDQISAFAAAEQNATKEYTDIGKQYNDILRELKAARSQRVDRATNSKLSFVGLVKELMDMDVNKEEGRKVALFQHATEKELGRLGKPHKYMNLETDLPILSHETIDALEKQEKEDENEKIES